jgi:hypothetical protein
MTLTMSKLKEDIRDGNSEGDALEHRESERRRHLRFPFTASVEAIEPQDPEEPIE